MTGLIDDGFQNLILGDKQTILEPDGSRASNWTRPVAAAVSPPTRVPTRRAPTRAHKGPKPAVPAGVSRAAAAAVSPPTRAHKGLTPAELNAGIKQAFEECNLDIKQRGLYAFVERVAKVYQAKLGPPPKQGRRMYLERNKKTRDAVKTTIENFIRLPYMSDVDETTKIMIPVMEVIFKMPAKGPPRGSQPWLRLQMQELSVVSWADMDEFPQLLRAYDKREVINHCADNLHCLHRRFYIVLRTFDIVCTDVLILS